MVKTHKIIITVILFFSLSSLFATAKSSAGLTEMQIVQGANGLALGILMPFAMKEEFNMLWMIPTFTTAGIVLPYSYSRYNSISSEAARFTTFMSIIGTAEGLLFAGTQKSLQDEENLVILGDIFFTLAGFSVINLIGTPTYGQTASIVSGAVFGGLLGLAFIESPFASSKSNDNYLTASFLGSLAGLIGGATLATSVNLSLKKVWTLDLGLLVGYTSGALLSYLLDLGKDTAWYVSIALSGLGLWASLEVTKNWVKENRSQINSHENVLSFNLPGLKF